MQESEIRKLCAEVVLRELWPAFEQTGKWEEACERVVEIALRERLDERWIPVTETDKLPAEGEPVELLATIRGKRHINDDSGEIWWWKSVDEEPEYGFGDPFTDIEDEAGCKITHWRPLPSSPEVMG